MYTSTYASSPVRAATSETVPINHQTHSYFREYYHSSSNNLNTMNDDNISSRRAPGAAYGNSTSSLASVPPRAPVPPRKQPDYYNQPPNDSSRYQPTAYTSSNRPVRNETEAFRSHSSRYDLNGSVRAQSYDNLLNEQYRSQSLYSSRPNNQYNQQQQQQQQQPRREQYSDYEDADLIVKSTDLPAGHEQEMINLVRTAFRKYQITNQRELAGFLKRAADKTFTPCWHCIVGRQFSSYVTHEMNGFIYFTKGPLSILLFKSGA